MNGRSWCLRPRLVVFSTVVALLLAIPAPPAAAQGPVIPPGTTIGGKTYAEWSAAWWQWAVRIPSPTNPVLDSTGQRCGVQQSAPVFFLAGSTSTTTVTRTQCTVRAGQPIFFPLINLVWAADPGDTEAIARAYLDAVLDQAGGLQLTVDSVPV